MIVGILHRGSGIGDQLFSYIATRVRAADLGVDFGFVGKEFFKGASFMNLDWGDSTGAMEYDIQELTGKLILRKKTLDEWHSKLYEINTPYFNPEFEFIKPYSIIDGYGAQDIRYFEHRLDEVREWLKVEPLKMPNDLCIINVRGGEYRGVPELFLSKSYWENAIRKILDLTYSHSDYPLNFEFHTDDPELIKEFGFTTPVYKDIELNWRSIRYAKHLIISNSAFAILPALLNENVKEIIAPKFWAGRNVGEWRRPGNYYKQFTYI